MDPAQKTFSHQDYELVCSARAVEGGRFAAALTISKQVWPSRSREIAVEKALYESEDAAIDAAHLCGLAWIRDYG